MGLIYQQPWTRQPQAIARISTAGPGRGLVASWTPIDRGFVLGGASTTVGNMSMVASERGLALQGTYQASNNYEKIARTDALAYTAQVTFEVLIKVNDFQTTVFPYISGIISQYQDGSSWGPSMRFNPDASVGNAAVPVFLITQSSGTVQWAVGVALLAGVVYHMIGTYDGANVALYVDGKQVGQTAASGAFDNPSTNFVSLLSEFTNEPASYNENRCAAADLYLARIYNTGKTAAEALALARNAWQLFAPLPRRIWAPSAAGAPPTLSSPGMYGITSTGGYPRVTRA